MRFLQINGSDRLSLVELLPDNLPPYAILSHTWGPSNEEVTYQDLLDGKGKEKFGYRKLILCGRQADHDGFQYFWVDTCCIDKTSSAELSEAINSMYSWYQSADVCYAYLADIGSKDYFPISKWFTRGWTLQELLAPKEMVFFDKNWSLLGTRADLQEEISERTRIPVSVLLQAEPVETFSVAQRMSWAAERKTTRIEDIAYCLLGIFNINMPLIYGEGENAFIRLQEEILKISDDHSIFAWRSADDRGGCLATSPASFRKSGNIVQCTTLDRSYDPVILSGKGVHLNIRFMGIGHDKLGCAKLDCLEQGSGDERITIFLRDMSLTMRHLRRVKTEEFSQTDFEDFMSSRYPVRRLCIQKSRVKSKRKGQLYGELRGTASITVASGQLPREELQAGSFKSLLEVVQKGTEDDVWMFLTRGNVEMNEADHNKQTALTHAARDGKENIVQMLLNQSGIDINPQDIHERTPTWWAASRGHTTVIRHLLETSKAKVNLANSDFSTPLYVAARAGHVEIVRLLSKTHGIDVNAKNKNWAWPLSIAVHSCNKAIVQLLVRVNGIDVDIKQESGQTLLLWATKAALVSAEVEDHSGRLDEMIDIITLLLQLGKANPNIGDKYGRTPFFYLAAERNESVRYVRMQLARELASYEKNSLDQLGDTPLLSAVLAEDLSVVELLLNTGVVNVNFQNKDGLSPLLAGLKRRNKAMIVLLLKTAEIDVNIRDKHGRTPVSKMVRKGDFKMFELLLTAPNILIDVKDDSGRTPLSRAAALRDSKFVERLLRFSDVNVNSQDHHGRTPLSWATASEDGTVVEKLLGSSDINVNLQDYSGRTPLSWAAAKGNMTVVERLLQSRNVDVNLQDEDGRTPLSWAAASGNNELFRRLLMLSDADINAQDNNGRTLLWWAASSGSPNLVSTLLQIPNIDVGRRDNDGKTPYSWVVGPQQRAVARLLGKRMIQQGLRLT